MVKLLDALPTIVDKLDAEILPVLDTLATVAPDLRDLLDVSKELNELISSVPGLGRVKKKIEDNQDSQDEYRALGVPLVFVLMGPLMVVGTFFAVTGTWSATALAASVPVGLLVAAILDGNEWRDINEDSRAGISTLSARIGRVFPLLFSSSPLVLRPHPEERA